MKKIVTFCSLIVLFTALGVFADELPVLDLDTVVVTATRYEKLLKDLPQSVTVIDEEEVEKSMANTLPELLNDVTGLQLQNYGSIGAQTSVSMRGMTSSQVLILIDGRPVNKFQDGLVDLSSIPVDNIASIEIVRGAASSLYGSSAMGGVINIITKKETPNKVDVSYGTFETYRTNIAVSDKADELVYTLTASYDVSEGDRENSGYYAANVNIYTGKKLSESVNVDVRAGWSDSTLGIPGMASYTREDDKQSIEKNFVDMEIALPAGVTLKGYSGYDVMDVDWEDWMGEINRSTHKYRESAAELTVSRDLAESNHAVIGVEYHDYQAKSTNTGSHSMQLISGFGQDEVKIADAAVITIGGRYDSYRDIDPEFSPSAALLVYLPGDTALRLSAGKSFRVPTFNDLYWDDPYMSGNPELKPETGTSYDAGIDTRIAKNLWVRIGGFYNDVKDMIIWAPVDPNDIYSPWTLYNMSSARIKGVETELRVKFLEYAELDVGYTALDTENKETGSDVIYKPDNKVDAKLGVTLDKTYCSLSLQHIGKRYHNDPDSTGTRLRLDPYTIYGAQVSHQITKTAKLYIKGENLFDKEYAFFQEYPMPGAAFYGGLKLTF